MSEASQALNQSLKETDERHVVALRQRRGHLPTDVIDESRQSGLLAFAIRGEAQQAAGLIDLTPGGKAAHQALQDVRAVECREGIGEL